MQSTQAPEPQALQQLLGAPVREALAAAELAHAAAQHLMLIIVLPPADDNPCGLGIRALAQPCSPPGSSPCAAVVLGGPRSVPEGKVSGRALCPPLHTYLLLCRGCAWCAAAL